MRRSLAPVLLGVLALVCWGLPAPAQADAEAPRSLADQLSYRWGDTPGEAGGWTQLRELKTPPGREGNAFLWLKVELPQSGWRDPALLLGRVVGAVEAYAGERRVYALGEIGKDGHVDAPGTTWQLVPLAPDLLGKPLYLRVASNDATGIGVQRLVLVGERADLLERVVRGGLSSFSLGALSLLLALVALCGALWRRSSRQLLAAFGAYGLSAGLVMWGVSDLVAVVVHAPIFLQRAMLVGAAWFAPALCFFLSSVMLESERRWFTWLNRALTALGVLLTVLAVVDTSLAQRTLMITIPLILCGMLACVVLSLIEARAGNTDARIFVGGLAVLFATATVDSLASYSSSLTGGFTFHWGMFAVTLSFALIVARQFSQVHDALSQHSRTLEQRHADVQQISARLALGAGELVGVVEQLRTVSGEQNQGLSRQAATLQETRITAEELKQIALVTAQKAQGMSEAAQKADDIGRAGEDALEKSLGSLESIRREVAEVARRIADLDARTRAIAGIVDTVKGLADQSNMLALNAAIEAVRSGEHGKGFSVVAREIRSLADQSIQATARIREILVGVAQGIRDTAELSARGQERVGASLQQVQQSGEQLRALSGIVRDTGASVRQISAAVNQQSAGIGQLFAAIDDLSRQMNDTLERLRATEDATQTVQNVAENMLGGQTLAAAGALREAALSANAA